MTLVELSRKDPAQALAELVKMEKEAIQDIDSKDLAPTVGGMETIVKGFKVFEGIRFIKPEIIRKNSAARLFVHFWPGIYQGLRVSLDGEVLKFVLSTQVLGKEGIPYVGIKFQEIDSNLAETMGIPPFIVVSVLEESPAEKAGIKRGDIIEI